jgi:hypothetical protein
MFPTDTDWQVHLAHHKELLRIAEQEWLARATLRTQPERQSLWCKAIGWIVARLPRRAGKRQPACDTQLSLAVRATTAHNSN